MSFSWNSCGSFCSNALPGEWNTLLAIEDLGLVQVAGSGNDGGAASPCNGCNASMPALHYDVISTGAIDDTIGSNFEDVPRAGYSSFGFMQRTLQGGTLGPIPTVNLMGFGTVRKAFNGGVNGYSPAVDTGTSFAAPQVASLALLFRQWLFTNSISLRNEAWMTTVNTLAMGDGRCGVSCAGSSTISLFFGSGFPRYFAPTSGYLGTFGAWGTRKEPITNGATVSWDVGGPGPESNNLNGWKFALGVDTDSSHTDVAGVTNLPNLNVRVVDTCNGNVVIRQAARQGVYYMMNIRQTADIRGRCLQVRVTGDGVRATGETFWATDYYFSNAVSQHLYEP